MGIKKIESNKGTMMMLKDGQMGKEMTPKEEQELKDKVGEAQMAFLSVMAMSAVHAGLNLFRYHSSATYYDNGDVQSMNFYKYAHKIEGYAALSIGSLLTIMQLLSMFGIANGVNMMMWQYGGMVFHIAVLTALGMLHWVKFDGYNYAEGGVTPNNSKT